jgi:putative hydrolase of the HAD superfamily
MLFLDIDDTILDHLGAKAAAAEALFDAHREVFVGSADRFVRHWHDIDEQCMQPYLAGRTTYAQFRVARIRTIFAQAGCELSEEDAQRKTAEFVACYEASWRAFVDVEPLLEQLGDMPVGIISNGDSVQQRSKLAFLGLTDRVSPVVISSDVGAAKPDAAIFLEACRQADVEPRDAVYVGDRRETDAQGSIDAGLMGVWLNRRADREDTGNVSVIHSLAQLPALLT